jgi:hypothetical protein
VVKEINKIVNTIPEEEKEKVESEVPQPEKPAVPEKREEQPQASQQPSSVPQEGKVSLSEMIQRFTSKKKEQ